MDEVRFEGVFHDLSLHSPFSICEKEGGMQGTRSTFIPAHHQSSSASMPSALLHKLLVVSHQKVLGGRRQTRNEEPRRRPTVCFGRNHAVLFPGPRGPDWFLYSSLRSIYRDCCSDEVRALWGLETSIPCLPLILVFHHLYFVPVTNTSDTASLRLLVAAPTLIQIPLLTERSGDRFTVSSTTSVRVHFVRDG